MADLVTEPAEPRSPTALAGFVRDCEHDRADTMEKLRGWLLEDRDGFYRSAVEVLRSEEDSRGFRSVLGLLIGDGLIEEALCDEELSLREAAKIARLAIQMDPQLEVRLARELASSVEYCQQAAVAAHAVRLISVLAEVSDGSRILPSLARLLHSGNPQLRSKAVLMMARGNRSTNWVQSRMADPDPRIRANAIEALWGMDSWHARRLLAAGARDSNNRVAGNALFGLFQLGDSSVLMEATKLAKHASPAFRVTAAWLIGEIGDERLRAPLAQLMRDTVPAVRSRAFKAMGRIKDQAAKTEKGESTCRIAGLFHKTEADSVKGTHRLGVSVTAPDGTGHVKVLATQFHLWEDGSPILNYGVTERPAVEAMSVVFILPKADSADAPWINAVKNCLSWKRANDHWAYLIWAEPGAPVPAPATTLKPAAVAAGGLSFDANPQALAASLDMLSTQDECAGLWTNLSRALRSSAHSGRAKRHVIVFCQEQVDGDPGDELLNALVAAGGSMQVISASPNPELKELCRRGHASFITVERAEEAVVAIEQAYLSLLARYEISYRATSPTAQLLEVQVRAPTACGTVKVPAPAVVT